MMEATSDGERRVVFDDGAATIVETWGSAGPLLLCVHGMTSSRRSWERTALHLRERYRVAAYDQRGHGESADVRGPMTLERSVRDFEAVAASFGEAPYAAIGHSWGGAVAILGGVRVPVERVCAIDPVVRRLSDEWYAGLFEEIAPLFAATGERRAALVREEYAEWPEIDRERKVHAVATMALEPLERLRDENGEADWDLLSALAGYPKPLLLALADPAESIVAAEDAERIAREGGKNVEVATFTGEGHNLHRLAFERFAERLERFLGEGD